MAESVRTIVAATALIRWRAQHPTYARDYMRVWRARQRGAGYVDGRRAYARRRDRDHRGRFLAGRNRAALYAAERVAIRKLWRLGVILRRAGMLNEVMALLR